jgi:hypothetical protein
VGPDLSSSRLTSEQHLQDWKARSRQGPLGRHRREFDRPFPSSPTPIHCQLALNVRGKTTRTPRSSPRRSSRTFLPPPTTWTSPTSPGPSTL